MNTIIGQSTLTNGFKSVMDSGRIVNSYIFTGPSGIGKKTISNFFAKLLLCDGEDKPCNRCKSCRQLDSGNHPDLIRVRSQVKTIGVDLIREVRADIGIKPFQSEWKIYIIEKGDTMTQQAQNAFLKTLEEPPQHAILIILADSLANLLPTIISRCQIVRIPRLSTKEISKIVKINTQLSHDEALLLAKLSEGLPGKALELASSHEYQQMRDETLGILEGLATGSLIEAMGNIDYFLDNRDKAIQILEIMQLWLRDVLVLKQGGNQEIIINLDKITRLEDLANTFTTQAIQCNIEEIENSKEMLMSHANFQMTFENLLIKIQGSGEYAGGSRSTV